MSNIGDKYIIVLSTYQLEWIKSLDGGIEELKEKIKLYDIYIQDYGKLSHKLIINEKGELELL